jgi:hypothetical protein
MRFGFVGLGESGRRRQIAEGKMRATAASREIFQEVIL